MAQSVRDRSLRERLLAGTQFLESCIRQDGGVSAVANGDVSGIWTTSEALQVICIMPFIPHDRFTLASRMWTFLEHAQIDRIDGNEGAWPLVKGGVRGSPIATGHAIAALTAAKDYFGTRLPAALQEAVTGGTNWLIANQGPNGGWPIEADTGRPNKDSYMISTVHAVMGLCAAGHDARSLAEMSDAAQWILSTQTRSGGFGQAPGRDADPCNTARAIRTLLQMRALSPDDPKIRRAVAYLKRSKPAESVWATEAESFVIEGGSGEVSFTRNTPADALEALMMADPDCPEVTSLVEWFAASQQANGSWKLHRARDDRRMKVETWSTSGAIRALIRYESRFASRHVMRVTSPLRDALVIGLSAGLAVETFLLLGLSGPLTAFWARFPVWFQAAFTGVALITAVILASYSTSAIALRRFRREE